MCCTSLYLRSSCIITGRGSDWSNFTERRCPRMSLDRRIRDGLQHSSSIVEPDVRRNLTTVRRKTHRAVLRQRAGLILLSAALVVGAVFATPGIVNFVQSVQHPRPGGPSPSPSSAPPQSA